MWPLLQHRLKFFPQKRICRWLRIYAVLPAIVLISGFMFFHKPFDAYIGYFFGGTYVVLMWSTVQVFLFAAAGSIAREKVEGTLGFVALSRVSPGQLLFERAFVLFLMAFTVWLASVPLMVLPVIIGGISGKAVLIAVAFLACVFAIVVCAGLLASTLAERPMSVSLVAILIGGAVLGGWFYAIGIQSLALFPGLWNTLPTLSEPHAGLAEYVLLGLPAGGLMVATALGNLWGWSPGPATVGDWRSILISAVLLAALISYGLARLAAWVLERHWKSDKLLKGSLAEGGLSLGLLRRFFPKPKIPVGDEPIVWLQKRQPARRLLLQGLPLVMAAGALTALWYGDYTVFWMFQLVLAVCLLLVLAALAVNALFEVHRSGTLELMGLTQISWREVVCQTLWQIYRPCLPAAVCLLLFWSTIIVFSGPGRLLDYPFGWLACLLFALSFLLVPVAGLLHSLHIKEWVGGWATTGWVILFVPLYAKEPLAELLSWLGCKYFEQKDMVLYLALGAQILIGCFLCYHLIADPSFSWWQKLKEKYPFLETKVRG